MEYNKTISAHSTQEQPFQPSPAEVTTKVSNCRFPGLVHKMLNSADPSVVSWIEQGAAFVIKDMVRDINNAIYFH